METTTAPWIKNANSLRERRYPKMKPSVGDPPTFKSWKDVKVGWIWATDIGNAAELVAVEPYDPDAPDDQNFTLKCTWECRCGKAGCTSHHMDNIQEVRGLDPRNSHCYLLFWETIDHKQYPNTCPRCAHPAYIGGGPANLDCSNPDCVSKSFGKVTKAVASVRP